MRSSGYAFYDICQQMEQIAVETTGLFDTNAIDLYLGTIMSIGQHLRSDLGRTSDYWW